MPSLLLALTPEQAGYITGKLFFYVLLAIVYFVPSYLGRKKKHAQPIFLVNLLTGFLVIGWVVALIWAIKSPKKQVQPVQY